MNERKKKVLHIVAQTHPSEDIYLINNDDLCDLVRDLALTKGQVQLLGSRLNEFNFLSLATRIS